MRSLGRKTTTLPPPIDTVLPAAFETNLKISCCLSCGLPTQSEQIRHQAGAAELSLMKEEVKLPKSYVLVGKVHFGAEYSKLCPDPRTYFSKVTFLFSLQWRHAEHLTFTRGESCLLVSLAYSEVWATGSELSIVNLLKL